MYDIAIIGLGPAGATFARLLSKKYNVIAIDKKNTKINKCCGGLLSPDAQKILAQFDICLPNDVLADPQIFSVKTIDFDNALEKFYQRFYVNMNRAKFDDFLISLIPENVKIYSDSICTKIELRQKIYHIELKNNGIKEEVKSKIIIGADGANSIVRNTFYRKRKITKYITIQEWYEDNKNSPFYSCIFDKKITNSYCWTISKDNYFIIGGAFPLKDSNNKFELLKRKIMEKGIAFEKLVKREGCFVYLNKGILNTCTGKKGAYLIGEAAGMISPSSLEGISYSMESAKILANIINKNTNNTANKYFFGTLAIRIKLFLKLFKKPFMYNRLLRKLIMKSGIKSIKKYPHKSF
ncbi:MAG: FAD-binding protein [Treponema sp.]|nr:FAD-binding protein [Treponema sp.]